MQNLTGKVALVTGGARGIGDTISTKLAEYGSVVAVSDLGLDGAQTVADKINAQGGKSRGYEFNVTDWDAAQDVVTQVENDLGPIAILVNNAGLSSVVPFLELEEDEWDRVLAVNLKGTFITCRAVLPRMVAHGHGRVVNMSSILGKSGEANFVHYSASKAGVIGLSQALAAEMAPHGITVNSVCPGIVDTPMWTDLYTEAVASSDRFSTEQDVRNFVLSRIPLGRTQTPEDIAEMVAYLVSDLARNMTGGSYHVDGGMQPR
jgi:meso-butanediol dehydrogenase/(S,S)-butanediol dehydrogenase/diacetyl reductase